MLIQSIYNLLDNPVPPLQTAASCCCVFKGHSIFLSCKLLQDGWEHGKVEDSLIVGPLSHLFGCEVSSLNRSNTVWNTIMIDKAFYKPTDGGFGRSIVCRKGLFEPESHVSQTGLKFTEQHTWTNSQLSFLFFWLPSAGST